jgi:hypothetical protein
MIFLEIIIEEIKKICRTYDDGKKGLARRLRVGAGFFA